jgi:hypothetical protein
MRTKLSRWVAALTLAAASGSACAMTNASVTPEQCRIVDAGKLPAEAGDAKSFCAAIVAAAERQAPGAPYSVEVHVLSPSSLAATVRLANGKQLPEQRMAVSDGELRKRSLDRFADALGAAIAAAR